MSVVVLLAVSRSTEFVLYLAGLVLILSTIYRKRYFFTPREERRKKKHQTSAMKVSKQQQTTQSDHMPSGFQRFETVIPPKTMSLEYDYQSFEDDAGWEETRSVLLRREMRAGGWEPPSSFPYHAIDERDPGHGKGAMHGGVANATAGAGGYSIVQKIIFESRIFELLDRFGCGNVSSVGDNDLASETGYIPPKNNRA